MDLSKLDTFSSSGVPLSKENRPWGLPFTMEKCGATFRVTFKDHGRIFPVLNPPPPPPPPLWVSLSRGRTRGKRRGTPMLQRKCAAPLHCGCRDGGADGGPLLGAGHGTQVGLEARASPRKGGGASPARWRVGSPPFWWACLAINQQPSVRQKFYCTRCLHRQLPHPPPHSVLCIPGPAGPVGIAASRPGLCLVACLPYLRSGWVGGCLFEKVGCLL